MMVWPRLFLLSFFLLILSFISISLRESGQSFAQQEGHTLEKNERDLITLRSALKGKYREMDSYLDVLFISLLAKQHVLAFGGPGGSKTETAKEVLKAMLGKKFSLQFSPSTKEDQIKGALKGKKFLEEGISELAMEQSLLMHDFAILDEIDKAGPEVLAAALAVLNERRAMVGDKEIEGRLQAALITSNMTLHEFLEKFRNTNDEATGMALLDRIMFKVLVLNRLSSAKELNQLFLCKDKDCPLPKDLNLEGISEKIKKIEVPSEVAKLSFLLWMKVGEVLEKKKREEQLLCREDPNTMPFPYTMTNQFSTRGAMKVMEVLKIAKYLENPQANSLSPEDIRLTHYSMIMQGPGEIGGPLLGKLKGRFESDPRTKKMMEDLSFEREAFSRVYGELLKGYQEELQDLTKDPVMESHGGKDPSTLSLQEKGVILAKIYKLREKIQDKRKNESALSGEVGEGPEEVARDKVLEELLILEKDLQAEKATMLVAETEIEKERVRLKKEKKKAAEKEQREQEEREKFINENLEAKATTMGAIFTRRTDLEVQADFKIKFPGEIWQEPGNGLLWFDTAPDEMTWEDAMKYCKDRGARLPSREDYIRLREWMGAKKGTADAQIPEGYKAQVLPHFNDRRFFSSSGTSNSEVAAFINGNDGGVYWVYKSGRRSVRCVSGE